ncbi:hypothetical protein E1264_25045 [Actinomadura sp. KC216]|nr:hypothetical protein E1264_25045 [Actinomadura sp. KC216]
MDMAPEATVPPKLRSANDGCYVERLPRDERIAQAARRCVSGLLALTRCSTEYIGDVELMASELGTNALIHGIRNTRRHQPIPRDSAEIWIYTRVGATGRELVIKVFDPFRGWGVDGTDTCEQMREHGRGLRLIANLTQGRWGHHPTMSRQETPPVPGKATWFALPLPSSVHIPKVLKMDPAPPVSNRGAVDYVHAMLSSRGIDGIIRKDSSTVSVLSLTCGLTVWYRARSDEFSWGCPDGDQERWPACDVVEVSERLVAAHAVIADGNAA